MVFLKLHKYQEVIQYATYALDKSATNTKALYRRALAYKLTFDLQKAMDDLLKSKSVQETPEVNKEIEEVTALMNSNPVPRAHELIEDALNKKQLK